MSAIKYLSYVLVFVMLSISCIKGNDGWNPVDWKTLPPAQPDDKIEIYYVAAPLLEDQLGKFFAGLKLFHGGLALVNTNTNFSITLNYDALHFFKAAFFPKIVKYDNGTKDLIWQNQGADFIYLGVNTTYWCEFQTLVSVIDGDLYNQFMTEFIVPANETFPYYDALGAESDNGTTYVGSWDCFDFVWKAMDWLSANGAHTTVQTLKRDHSYLYSKQPPLNVTYEYYNDENVRDDIISLYEFFQLQFNDLNLLELLGTVVILFEQRFYLRVGTDYWKLLLEFPYLDLQWADVPFPDPNNSWQAVVVN